MHTVAAELCTGCELCIAPCPVDCITMVAVSAESVPAGPPDPRANRQRYAAHEARVQRRAAERADLIAACKQLAVDPDRHTP